jgi:hypothetical protein
MPAKEDALMVSDNGTELTRKANVRWGDDHKVA